MNAEPPTADSVRPLRRGALVVWAAWLAGSALLVWQWRHCTPHPHFLPLTVLLLIQALVGAATLGWGLWRVVRGPSRGRAAGWTAVAMVPILLWTAHFSYALWCNNTRYIPLNGLTRTVGMAAAALMDGKARIDYPQRLAGERVEMIYDRCPDPEGQVAAMDRHVARLEAVLGRRGLVRLHWVRGPLFGIDGRAMLGLALGSPGETVSEEPDGLLNLDRHEVAHMVLEQFTTPDTAPPALLMEGWAEAHSGYTPEFLAQRLAQWRAGHRRLTLRELVGPRWYCRHEWEVYIYGAPLVRYLLREYGPDKFIELYCTCRQDSFADDCQRILGVTLEQLDERYQADARELAAPKP